jgi:polyisoprenyl-teichoic acid--peptidoglycan teichoic acid transferase
MKADNTEWLPAWEDPDAPARPPASAPAGTPPPPGRHDHPWRRRLLIGGISLFTVTVLAVGAGYVYYRWRFAQIHKQNITGLAEDGGTMNVLLVGSDSRANVEGNNAFNDKSSPVTGQRSDTMMILHADTKQKKAMILSIPRDLYVPIAGTSGSNRINTAFDNGAQRLVDTIQQDLGIKINHYVQVDFVGFQSIVNSVGGVDIYVPAPARDTVSGLSIKTAGCAHLDGFQALAWARSRHFEELEGGRWQSDPTGDLGRIQRQQDFIRRMLRKALATRNPIKVNQLIGIGIKNVQIDQQMSSGDILRLASKFRSLNPDAVDMLTLPTTPFSTRIGGLQAAVLRLKQPEAQSFIDRVNGIEPPPPAAITPEDVRVRVLNGTGQTGLAAQVSVALQGPGFTVADRGDATGKFSESLIRYGNGALEKAQLLQRYLQNGARVVSDPSLRTVDLALVVGSDYAGVRDKPAPVPPTTTPTTVASGSGPTTTIPACQG